MSSEWVSSEWVSSEWVSSEWVGMFTHSLRVQTWRGLHAVDAMPSQPSLPLHDRRSAHIMSIIMSLWLGHTLQKK